MLSYEALDYGIENSTSFILTITAQKNEVFH